MLVSPAAATIKAASTPHPLMPKTRVSPFENPHVHTIGHPDGLQARFMDWGATWLSCEVPMPGGQRRQVLLGLPRPEDHGMHPGYLGATVGRYANRIAGGQIERDGSRWSLHTQPGTSHTLHGGTDGFDRRRWSVIESTSDTLRLDLVSPAGDQGWPGTLHTTVTYRILAPLMLEMDIRAVVDQPCPVAITQHAYFNLDAAQEDIRSHRLQVRSSRYAPVDHELIPIGPLEPVRGTSMDFRHDKPIGQDLLTDDQQRLAGGYDHGWLLDESDHHAPLPAARLTASDGSLSMTLSTTLPALQVYTGNHLAGLPSRNGRPLVAHAGVALEAGLLANSPAHPEWPQHSSWLQPGDVLRHHVRWTWEHPSTSGRNAIRST